jgi:hypothetical protein
LGGDDELERLLKLTDELADLFEPFDRAGLDRCDETEREDQLQSRMALYEHTTRLWDEAKAAGLDPANNPELAIIGAMRDLAMALWGNLDPNAADRTEHG